MNVWHFQHSIEYRLWEFPPCEWFMNEQTNKEIAKMNWFCDGNFLLKILAVSSERCPGQDDHQIPALLICWHVNMRDLVCQCCVCCWTLWMLSFEPVFVENKKQQTNSRLTPFATSANWWEGNERSARCFCFFLTAAVEVRLGGMIFGWILKKKQQSHGLGLKILFLQPCH